MDKVQQTGFAVVDLATVPALKTEIMACTPPAGETLFMPDMAPEVREVGPWLVDLTVAPQIGEKLAGLPPGTPWGYYVESPIDLLSLRYRLRRYNLAKLPDTGKEVLFRYWDPRVMGVFLDVATRAQRAQLFERIDRIHAADGSFDATEAGNRASQTV